MSDASRVPAGACTIRATNVPAAIDPCSKYRCPHWEASALRKCATKYLELGERQHVAVGVGEPGDLVAAGCRPDAAVVLVHAVVGVEDHAAPGEIGHGACDVVALPAEDRVTGRRHRGGRRQPEHRPVRVDDAREVILVDDAQAEDPLIEPAAAVE